MGSLGLVREKLSPVDEKSFSAGDLTARLRDKGKTETLSPMARVMACDS